MARPGAVRASIPFLIAAGAAALGILWLAAATPGAGQSSSVEVIAIDVDPRGNGPRTVGTVEDCISATVDQPIDVDIVVPGPGIPADRGMAAYQFSILYDPAVVWIGADERDMLLAQAPGSNVIPISDPKPDSNGVYQSWGVDFGTSGIEPAGASEIGPGVIARITLLPQSAGVSTLTLSNVLVIDDASERISLEAVQSATIHVGEPCSKPTSQQQATLTPTPTPSRSPSPVVSTPTPSSHTPTPASGGTGGQALAEATGPGGTGGPAGGVDAGVGSLAPVASSVPAWAALASGLGGAGLLIAGRLALQGRTRRRASPRREKAPNSPDVDSVEPPS